jgi:hypothetical protein
MQETFFLVIIVIYLCILTICCQIQNLANSINLSDIEAALQVSELVEYADEIHEALGHVPSPVNASGSAASPSRARPPPWLLYAHDDISYNYRLVVET